MSTATMLYVYLSESPPTSGDKTKGPKGTSFRSEKGELILQGDASCLPIVLQDYKYTNRNILLDGPVKFTAEIITDESSKMLEKFTDGMRIKTLCITAPFDILQNGNELHRYINESAQASHVELTIRVDSRGSPAKYAPWFGFGALISKWDGFNAQIIQDFILGIRPMDTFSINMQETVYPVKQYDTSPVIDRFLILGLSHRHKHTKFENLIDSYDLVYSTVSAFKTILEETADARKKSWTSLQFVVTFDIIKKIMEVDGNCKVYVKNSELAFDMKKPESYALVGREHCFYSGGGRAVFVGPSLMDNDDSIEEEYFELRFYYNVDPKTHPILRTSKLGR